MLRTYSCNSVLLLACYLRVLNKKKKNHGAVSTDQTFETVQKAEKFFKKRLVVRRRNQTPVVAPSSLFHYEVSASLVDRSSPF